MKKGFILSRPYGRSSIQLLGLQKPWGKSPKSFILTGILLSVFLLATVALAELTDWEKQVYYDFLESSILSPKSEDVVYAEVANRYSTTVDTLKSIEAKSKDEEPTDWEVGVFRDLAKKLTSLPQGYSQEDAKSIYREVASKYGIRRGQVHAIELRCFAWDVPY